VAHQVAAGIAAGCPVIVKPSEHTPLSCLRFVQILRQAGLPAAWVQVITTTAIPVAEQLVTDPRVGMLSFIGSSQVGWMLRSKVAPGTRCALEHGGAAPVILAEDADHELALAAVLKGGFYHAGQVCVSVQRVFVPRDDARAFAERLATRARRLRLGDPTDSRTRVGPLIRPEEASRVHDWVSEAVTGGAVCLCGGRPRGRSLYECTVLLEPPTTARVSRLEIFGPVVCVYGYDTLEDAIDVANSLPVAFQGAVFTRSFDVAMHVYQRLDASAVMLNDHTAFRTDGMPFAGLRESGLGVGGMPYAIREMRIEKMLVMNPGPAGR
jgi:acyl-CoA reductase-like NAD-dependent aldehyde dehydrogenase